MFDWHSLISGDVETVHLSGISVYGRIFSDDEVNEEEIDLHIINWVE
ncbi:hypothetical protein [Candidatus Ruthia endofausta]|nr:hypothetical protein [Candidatus Ruthia endofausta]